MIFKLTIFSVAIFLAMLLNIITSYIAWRRRKTKGGWYFALAMLALTFWTLVAGLDYVAIPISLKVFFAKLEALGYGAAFPLMAAFCIVYAGNEDWLRKSWVRVFFVAIPAVIVLLYWTNNLHGWVWAGWIPTGADNVVEFVRGPAYRWITLVGYTFFALMLFNLAQASFTGPEPSRKQGRLLLLAVIVPVVGNAIYQTNALHTPGLDWSSIVFSLSGAFIMIAFYFGRLLEIVPIARNTIIERMTDIVLVLDNKGHLVDFNQAAQSLLGLQKENLWTPVETALKHWPKIVVFLQSPVRPEVMELPIDGESLKVVDLRITPLRDNLNMEYGQVVAMRDITERVKQENALRSAQQLLLDQQRTMAAFDERERLARELHDGIGQVLAYFNMQMETVSIMVQKGENVKALQTLSRLADVAQESHADLRSYIRELKGSKTAPHQDFFAMLGRYCTHLWQSYLFRVDLTLPEDPPEVLASARVETNLTYIIREALGNARRHSGKMEARVAIEVDEQYVQATISDEGAGFDGIYLGPERRKHRHYGLSFMRERADIEGGSLQIKTAPGQGTRVIVRLPRQLVVEELPPARVLIVDDHPLFVEGLKNMLSARGAHVVGIAQDGIEAQTIANALKPEIILMDINMPNMDGLEATRHISADLPGVKIVMLTTSSDEQHLLEAMRAGAWGYLTKGMNTDEFISALNDVLHGETIFSAGMASQIMADLKVENSAVSQTDEPALTERQIEILRLVAQGLLYKEIGMRLFITERTVKYHMGEILSRLRMKSRQDAVEYAKRKGL